MLLIDGVRYDLWTPPSEDEFERVVVEHASDIFGQGSIYFDRKQKLKSLSGIGSIPDGYAIILADRPQWHIVEVELSSHPLHEHIVSQVSRFLSGIANPSTRNQILRAMFDYISGDRAVRLLVEEAIQSSEVYKFLADLVVNRPVLTIIIEEKTSALEEAVSTLAHSEIKTIQFQTYIREGVGLAVHAHLFEPVFQFATKIIPTIEPKGKAVINRKAVGGVRVTAKNLIDANILKVGQIVYGWHQNTKYEGKVLNDGSIELLHTGKKFPSLNAAVRHVKGSEEDAWRWWLTTRENGSECVLDELRKEHRATHP